MTEAELQALLDAASPGPWHHVNPGMVSPKTRTVHGPVPAERIDYVSTWPGLGTPDGHRVVIDRRSGVRSADMALIAEVPALAAEVLALRAGAAASAERIKELEAKVAELEAALVKANEPEWFFGNAGKPHFSLYEAVKTHVDPTGGLLIGAQTHFVKVDTARPCKTIWALARFHEPSGEWRVLPCATEAEARALLKESDQ